MERQAGKGFQHGTSGDHQGEYCDSCREEGRNSGAVTFCTICVTFLCQNCNGVHSRLPFTRNHMVLRGEYMPKRPKPGTYFQRGTGHVNDKTTKAGKGARENDKTAKLDGSSPENERKDTLDTTGPEYVKMVYSDRTGPEYSKAIMSDRTSPEYGKTIQSDKTGPEYGKTTYTGQVYDVHKLKRIEQVNVKTAVDKCDCHITGVAVTKTGDILAVDSQNGKVKLLSSDGNLLSYLWLTHWARDVCVLDETTAVANSPLKVQVDILDISNRLAIAERGTIPIRENVWGVTVCDENLAFICGYPPAIVRKITLEGKVLWSTYSTDRNGQKVFEKLDSITSHVGENGTAIYVTDRDKETITILSGVKGEILKVCPVTGKEPLGIAVDYLGHVYVCYSKTREIVVWSKDLTECSCLVSNCRSEPTAIVYHPEKQEMIASYRYTDSLDRIILIYAS